MKLLQSMSMRQRVVLGGAALGVLVVAFLLFSIASKPSYTLVSSGLDPAQTGRMTTALDERGIAYEIRNNGTALAVEKSQTATAQIALSEAGLGGANGGGGEPWKQFDEQKLGSSSFQQQVAYQRALEAQIAQTIGGVQGVNGAQVQLTLPEDQLFADEAKPATAAVLLSGDSGSLESASVKGIANLVASSVEGLKTENVTIADGAGRMLWPAGENGGAGSISKAAAEARYASQLETSLNALLLRTLGPDKGQVRVNAQLNVDDTSIEELRYERGVPLERSTETEQLEGGAAAAGAAAGTTANVPGYAEGEGAGAGGDSNYESEKQTTKMAVGKTIRRTKVAPGEVERLDVALVVDDSVEAADVAALRGAVRSAAGIQPDRGDTFAVSQIAFAEPAQEPTSSLVPPEGVVGYAKYALLALASLLFLFFVTRHLRRREDEVLANPTWLRQLDAPTPIKDLEAEEQLSLTAGGQRRRPIDEVVQKEPERVATALRSWMNEDRQ